jgi:hypothetical protein
MQFHFDINQMALRLKELIKKTNNSEHVGNGRERA